MQYPQIQFYRGSLVRLGSGRIKQVEDLSSDDFLESARFIGSQYAAAGSSSFQARTGGSSGAGSGSSTSAASSRHGSKQSIQEEQANHSVFSSPQPTSSSESPNFDSMEVADCDPEPASDDDDDDEELDVVSDGPREAPLRPPVSAHEPEICIESSVVRDFLEVGAASSPSSPFASTSSSQLVSPNPAGHCSSVLVKFFLESSRTVVFTEVSAGHPFFVFHRGWSSWNPQLTYDKFGLKCRKLKIGDTCISLIRHATKRKPAAVNQQDSDQCNFLFSSININE